SDTSDADEPAVALPGLSAAPVAPMGASEFLLQAQRNSEDSSTVLASWLCADGSLQPGAQSIVAALFHGVDRGDKGHLSTDELAWLLSLQEKQFDCMVAAV